MKRLWKIWILFHHFKSPLTHTKSRNHIHHNCRKLPKKITFKTEDHLDSKRTRRKTRENAKTSPQNPRKKWKRKLRLERRQAAVRIVVRKKLNPEHQETHKFFQGKTTEALQNLIKSTPLDTDDNRKLFMRSFICFIQKVFLLPNSTANITPIALPTIFDLETIRSRNWALHVHNFLLQELKKAKQNKTVSIHGCVYILMIIYFHETHFGENSKEVEAQAPWLAYWTGETLKNRMKQEKK
ncbi:hypothetical protein PIB30_036205 [Stylosanthes scabra]|uniref:Uncharacterized protein n=1 Tax=Stylosanthes scabra TaxID=79078 RepID=A0ABU6TD19_9FABA|nr:hypothetical protein [Stylosanthes scabra]